MYDKNFDVALVCQDGTASIILKNERTVMSYRNDISVDDYQKQMEKFQEIYEETFNQDGKITDKLGTVLTSNMKKYKHMINIHTDIHLMMNMTYI